MVTSSDISLGSHILRFGTPRDQKYLLGDFRETYDQLVINATMVAHMPAAMASFVVQRAQKPYFIDPQIHAFQHDVANLESNSKSSKGEIRRSVTRLLEQYGEPANKIIMEERRPISPRDFGDARLRKEFTKRVVDYQLNALSEQTETSEDNKYYAFLKRKEIIANTGSRPSFVVAPYFYLKSNTLNTWMDLNLSFAEDARQIASENGIPVAVQIVIHKSLLESPQQIRTLVNSYSDIDANAFLVWIDSFHEQDGSEEALNGLLALAGGLKKKAPVVNLYSGFFSTLLVHIGILAGATHSLEYGESRAVEPVGGGPPVAKFYLPALHKRLAFRTAFRAVRSLGGFESTDAFHEKICACRRCMEIIASDPNSDFIAYGRTKQIKGRPYPTAETTDSSVRHYMWSKAREFAKDPDIPRLLEDLRIAASSLQMAIGTDDTEHCRIWADILSSIKK